MSSERRPLSLRNVILNLLNEKEPPVPEYLNSLNTSSDHMVRLYEDGIGHADAVRTLKEYADRTVEEIAIAILETSTLDTLTAPCLKILEASTLRAKILAPIAANQTTKKIYPYLRDNVIDGYVNHYYYVRKRIHARELMEQKAKAATLTTAAIETKAQSTSHMTETMPLVHNRNTELLPPPNNPAKKESTTASCSPATTTNTVAPTPTVSATLATVAVETKAQSAAQMTATAPSIHSGQAGFLPPPNPAKKEPTIATNSPPSKKKDDRCVI